MPEYYTWTQSELEERSDYLREELRLFKLVTIPMVANAAQRQRELKAIEAEIADRASEDADREAAYAELVHSRQRGFTYPRSPTTGNGDEP